MKRRAVQIVVMVLLAAVLTGWPAPSNVAAVPLVQGSTLVPLAPAACPARGCAAGQRLSYRLDFEIGAYSTAAAPNVKVCVYIPTSWYDAGSVQMDANGTISGAAYAPSGNCAEDPVPPAGYSLAAGGAAALTDNYFNDTLNLSFRIARTASAAGSILMRVFERDAGGAWLRTTQIFTAQLQVAPRATTAYIAADAAACSSQPCYLNSGGDQASGLGTGLRDAIDALDEASADLRVVVLGNVGLKGNTVLVNKPVTIEGSGDATLTTVSGAACDPAAALLRFGAGGSLRGLNLNDGGCSGANNRPLVVVDSSTDVSIESNDLSGGSDAIRVSGSGGGNVTVRYNHIRGNNGYALYWDNSSGARLDLVANNLDGNRSGDQVECAAGASAAVANRVADHNFWGGQVQAASAHCTVSAGKHLGAPVQALSGAPGVDARRVTVTGAKTYAFNNQIAYARSGGSDFDIFVVNHGKNFPEALPFSSLASAPNPCSNAWDVFLAGGAPADTTLELSLRYDGSAACIAAVETSSYCEQTTAPQNYPLWWYDPGGSVTAGWDTTGQRPAGSGAGGANGQATSCDLTAHEIKVSIDSSGRPDLGADLRFTPLLIGIPVPATWQAFASDRTITLVWTTTSEPDITGFTVLRSQTAGGSFDPISDLIPRRGSATGGSSYSFADGGRINGVASYYRLRVTRSDGGTILTDVLSIVPNVATVTPTPTRTSTRTATATFTPFRLPNTAVPVATRAFTATRAFFATATRNLTPGPGTIFPTASLSPGPGTFFPTTSGGYPPPGSSGTPLGGSATVTVTPTLTPDPGTPTITPTPSRTPAPTLSRAEQIRGASRFISLVMGLLISAVVVGGLTWLLFRRRPA